MTRIRLIAVAVLLCSLATAFTTLAQDKQGEKKGPNALEAPKDLKLDDKTTALHDLALASKLIAFGRDQKNPEAILLAAKILHANPTSKLKAAKNEVSGKGNGEPAKQKESTPKSLIAEAKAMSSAPHVTALVTATEQAIAEDPRGRVGGPARLIQTVQPGQTWTVATNFEGRRRAEVDIDLGGVFGRCVMTVHDEFGNLIARDAVPGNFYNCRWVPAFAGTFAIRLTNVDTIPLRCDLLTN